MCLVQIVMLNMLLAVVIDVYSAVKSDVFHKGEETLWSQAWEIWIRSRGVWRGELMSVGAVLDSLGDGQGDAGSVCTTTSLKELIPRIREEQVEQILRDSWSFGHKRDQT